MLGDGATLSRVATRIGTGLSATTPTGAAVAGGLAYLAVRARETAPD
jgi:hypothetical protein